MRASNRTAPTFAHLEAEVAQGSSPQRLMAQNAGRPIAANSLPYLCLAKALCETTAIRLRRRVPAYNHGTLDRKVFRASYGIAPGWEPL